MVDNETRTPPLEFCVLTKTFQLNEHFFIAEKWQRRTKFRGVWVADVVGMYICFLPTLWGIFTLWGRHCGELTKIPHNVGEKHMNFPTMLVFLQKQHFPTVFNKNLDAVSYIVGN